MTIRLLEPFFKAIKNYHLWLITLMFIIGIIFHYPQQLFITDSTSLFSFLGFTRHAAERVFLLLPVTYTGYFLGVKAGLSSLIIALAIMLPRDFLISQYPQDSILETTIVIFIGGLINILFFFRRRDILNLKKVENKLQLAYAEIEQIFKTAAVGIRVIDTDFNIMQCNETFSNLLKLKQENIVGKKCYEVFSHGLCHTDKCLLKRIINGEDRVESEIKKEFSEYGSFNAICTATPYRQPDGKLLGIIESTSDVTKLKKAEDNLHYYLQEITRAQEEERKRISRELHDSTAQNLVAILHQLENYINEKKVLPKEDADSLWTFYKRIKDISQEIRRFSRDLRPSVLDDLGLIPTLEWITEDYKNEYGLAINLKVTGDKRRLSRESELLLFRIVQEALRNVVKHAKASKVDVGVEFQKNKITIKIGDDGIGFKIPDKFDDLPKTGKLGLAGIQERIKLMNGTLSIESELGNGTTLFAEIPV